MERPDYILGQFRETARCRDANFFVSMCNEFRSLYRITEGGAGFVVLSHHSLLILLLICWGYLNISQGSVFTVRRSALHGLSYRNSVCLSVRPSVRLSVCLSVTLVHCVHTVRPTLMISSPHGSHIILVSGDIKFIPKFEGGHPERGR